MAPARWRAQKKNGKQKKRGRMREVLISKKAMKLWRNCFSCCRAAQAQRKAIRTFNGRLRAFLLIFNTDANNSDRRGHQHFSHTFPKKKEKRSSRKKRMEGAQRSALPKLPDIQAAARRRAKQSPDSRGQRARRSAGRVEPAPTIFPKKRRKPRSFPCAAQAADPGESNATRPTPFPTQSRPRRRPFSGRDGRRLGAPR